MSALSAHPIQRNEGPPPVAPPPNYGGHSGGRPHRRVPIHGLKRAVWLAMASMSAFFLCLTFAYLQRHGLGDRWWSTQLGILLAGNTLTLIASSLALHRSRVWLLAGGVNRTLAWISAAFGLGLMFLAGQGLAWRLLFRSGVYVAQYPNSGFFYLVTAAHAAHLMVGLGLMGYVFTHALRGRLRPEHPLAMDLTSIVWHMLDFTWIYIFLVLWLWR